MAIYLYDGSFEGLLTCFFEIYSTKIFPISIQPENGAQIGLLDHSIRINTDDSLAERVLSGINQRSQDEAGMLVYRLYLSELPGIEMTIYHLVKILVERNDASLLHNYADEQVLKAAQVNKVISREIHRMHAFVRFQKTQGGVFYAPIEPDFNVMPLIGEHFERRYADQRWIIFDTKRHYGLFYDLHTTEFITAEHSCFTSCAGTTDERESDYQLLWKNYFHSVNISERNNVKLHLRHMPRRYWKYLLEKNPAR